MRYSSLEVKGNMLYRAPRGTADILPPEQDYWRYVEQVAVSLCQGYGYQRLDCPVFEDTRLFTRSVGEDTDIVTKEMYTLEDKGGNSLTLRPEGTAPVCRAYLEHGMSSLPRPVKLYYLAAIYRYERPQAGRLREHHQFGYEAIGDADPAVDAEVIDMAWQFCQALKLSWLSLQLNSIGCKKCRPPYLAVLKNYYSNYSDNICPECKIRLKQNPLRLLDCKQPSCQQIAGQAPRSIDHLCPECTGHFNQLKEYLGLLNIPFSINHRLVRGLDYYTRTVFEILPEGGSAQSTIGGGGRYDNLIEELGGKSTPALGFAAGIERIVLNLKQQNISIPPLPQPRVFLAYTGDELKKEALKLAAQLRKGGSSVIMAMGCRSLKAQLRQANSLGTAYAVIIGDEELKKGTVILRDMTTATQKTMPISKLPKILG